MPAPREEPLRFVPRGVTDTVNGDNSAPGSMYALTNLIRDPSTPGVFVCRPANTLLSSFTGLTSPGVVSAALTIGGLVYGMVATGSPAGKDRPFVYNIVSNSFETVAGITSANCPTTQPTSGAWTPPTMDALGSLVIVTHPGFNFASGYAFGYFDVSGYTSTPTGNTTNGSPTIANVSNLAGLNPGYTISGTGIPANTTILNYNATAMTITLSANATATNTGVTLTIAGGAVGAPLWAAGNTTGATQLAGVPQAVKQFSNRAYFAQKNNLVFTDTLSLNISNSSGTQVLTIGDTTDITALSGLPENTTSSGILQALLAFKAFSIWQITGDAALMTLDINALIDSVGTSAPRSVQITARGVDFMANDGQRYVDLTGTVSEPNVDLALPFIYTQYPSRVASGFNAGTYRICVKNTNKLNDPSEDYHYNYKYDSWTGPHTFPYDLAVPYDNDFIVFSNTYPGKIWRAYSVQNLNGLGANFVENGSELVWNYQTPSMTSVGNMYANCVVRTTIEMALPATGDHYIFQSLDEDMSPLALATINTKVSGGIWNAFNWGDGTLWGSSLSGLKPVIIPWTEPPIFNRLIIQGTGNCSLGLKLGALYIGYERLRYLKV